LTHFSSCLLCAFTTPACSVRHNEGRLARLASRQWPAQEKMTEYKNKLAEDYKVLSQLYLACVTYMRKQTENVW
jgi:hypothetical protein